MGLVKTDEEIALLRENNQLVSRTLAEVAKHIAPGVTGLKLDKIAEQFIRDHGAVPGFLGYNGFPNTLCISINDVVIHGVPSAYELRDGDIVSVDCGTRMKGYVGDSAYTFAVGSVSESVMRLLRATKESLKLGVAQAVEGKRVGDISSAVQRYVESLGYSVVREMVGHGIGTRIHEKPDVPNFGRCGSGKKLIKGMTICVEPMINMGKRDIVQEKDGWTIRTKDRKASAHFEYAVAVGKEQPDVLTTFEYVEEVLKQKGNMI
ncbi:MAG: type I methionyl aminopeptidase [Prevotellaceae bacterium]|jgi:methionyl aminopeptidase|nr:type I methionyl aminopeptidase [Prevotellaceae bacterium]